ncbi:MAG: beta galactosidase jelly roll domain-containing protein [Bacteroidales bacterium]|nr:beta galactosidase jelly roll domain-containing protein [Bacteroidales bacterium]
MKKSLMLLLGMLPLGVFAQNIKLPVIYSDNMVIQCDKNFKINGTTTAKNSTVTVVVDKKKYTSTSSADGKFSVEVASHKAGGPYELLTIAGKDTLKIKDVYFGDVWLMSGQSNMELPIRRVEWNYPGFFNECDIPQLRQFFVKMDYDFHGPKDDFRADNAWKVSNKQNVTSFSAVAYFFQKEMFEKTGRPQGVIVSAVGGSPVEAWMEEQSIKANYPNLYKELLICKEDNYVNTVRKYDAMGYGLWNDLLASKDQGVKENWKDNKTDFSNWETVKIPVNKGENHRLYGRGSEWFKKSVTVNAKNANEKALLVMGVIEDGDSIFVNGKFIGNITYCYPPRRYPIPQGVLKAGENIITVHMWVTGYRGGFIPDKNYRIEFESDTLDISGTWYHKHGCDMPAGNSQTFFQYKPAGLYNGMIAPLKGVNVKGMVWYQGESNVSNSSDYGANLKMMVNSWRKVLDNQNIPFVIVQLPNYLDPVKEPEESSWAQMRWVQYQASKEIPNAGITCNLDLGEWNDIHPLNKKPVGQRIAAQMRSLLGEKIVSQGPIAVSAKLIGEGKAVVEFDNIGGGLKAVNTKNQSVKYFAVAGSDRKYVWAEAKLEGNKVVLTTAKFKNIKYIRYAWADCPENPNLYNKEGFPALPFEITVK